MQNSEQWKNTKFFVLKCDNHCPLMNTKEGNSGCFFNQKSEKESSKRLHLLQKPWWTCRLFAYKMGTPIPDCFRFVFLLKQYDCAITTRPYCDKTLLRRQRIEKKTQSVMTEKLF